MSDAANNGRSPLAWGAGELGGPLRKIAAGNPAAIHILDSLVCTRRRSIFWTHWFALLRSCILHMRDAGRMPARRTVARGRGPRHARHESV